MTVQRKGGADEAQGSGTAAPTDQTVSELAGSIPATVAFGDTATEITVIDERPADNHSSQDLTQMFGAMPTQRVAGTPVWRQIETILRDAITARRIMPGQRLPTETQFASFFGVHRHTVRRAVAPLVADGLVSVRQGHGMTVRDQMIDYPVTMRTRFSEIIASQSLDPSGDIVDMAVEAAPREVAVPLGIMPGATVVRVEMLRWADGVPISIASDYVSQARFPSFEATMREMRSITKTMTLLGAGDYQRARTTVYSRMPTPTEADLLRQPPNQPVMCADSVNICGEMREVVQFTQARFASQRAQLIFDSGA